VIRDLERTLESAEANRRTCTASRTLQLPLDFRLLQERNARTPHIDAVVQSPLE
jgi:hypothetical protein